MVANPSNYRRPIVSSRSAATSFSCIESLRRIIRRGAEAAFLIRGHDRSFCEAIADEAMLAIHADIDEYDHKSDFRAWAIAIAIRIGFEKIRKLHVTQTRLLQTELPQNSEADTSNATAPDDGSKNGDQQRHLELEQTRLDDKTGKKLRVAQELLRLHREMVQRILDGKNPFYVAQELKLSDDFQQIFMSEAVRKLKLLRRHLRTEFAVPTPIGLR